MNARRPRRARPTLALSIGCPSGIGPEVSVVAAAQCRVARILLVGDAAVIARAARLRGVPVARLVRVESAAAASLLAAGSIGVLSPGAPLRAADARAGRPSRAGGAAQLAWIDAACDAVSRGDADALVTGPVSKHAIASSGSREAARFLGHTEHLQRRLKADEVVMAFASERFTTALVTTHLPLARVPRAVTRAAVASATYWLADLLVALAPATRRGRTAPTPRIAVASLNPHAGEGGLLGDEESDAIVPGMALARARAARAGLRCAIEGPVPAETAFRVASRPAGPTSYDGVVAMYHDQATIPMKLVGFGEAVNVSLGLPIVRTSVDHGTAYDIAGKAIADPRGMASALDLAARLAVATGGASRTRRTPRPRRRAPRPSA